VKGKHAAFLRLGSTARRSIRTFAAFCTLWQPAAARNETSQPPNRATARGLSRSPWRPSFSSRLPPSTKETSGDPKIFIESDQSGPSCRPAVVPWTRPSGPDGPRRSLRSPSTSLSQTTGQWRTLGRWGRRHSLAEDFAGRCRVGAFACGRADAHRSRRDACCEQGDGVGEKRDRAPSPAAERRSPGEPAAAATVRVESSALKAVCSQSPDALRDLRRDGWRTCSSCTRGYRVCTGHTVYREGQRRRLHLDPSAP
jgi:hypothetical protein